MAAREKGLVALWKLFRLAGLIAHLPGAAGETYRNHSLCG